MGLNDFVITPLYFVLFLLLARLLRPYFTTNQTKKYFIPALLLKMLGALAVGLIYQFYYGGGDTFNYHTHGSIHIWEALFENPKAAFSLWLDKGYEQYSSYEYASKIWYYGDPASYAIVKLAAIFDIFTIATYSATSLFFAALSFSGLWALYSVFAEKYPDLTKQLAWGILFVPSMIFWGSGIFKDTVVLTVVGWSVYCFYQLFIKMNIGPGKIAALFLSMYIIYVIKIYVILMLIPSFIIWVVYSRIHEINTVIIRRFLWPVTAVFVLIISYFSIDRISSESQRYSLDNIAKTAAITSYDIRYGWGARDGAGSGYDLGKLDGSLQSMMIRMPQAINVTLFRPYLWEVGNPLMLIASIESLMFLLITIYVLSVWIKWGRLKDFLHPDIFFSLLFSLGFAFAVGISTYNFGTLSRYKLPLLPFYLIAIILLWYYSNKRRKSSRMADLE